MCVCVCACECACEGRVGVFVSRARLSLATRRSRTGAVLICAGLMPGAAALNEQRWLTRPWSRNSGTELAPRQVDTRKGVPRRGEAPVVPAPGQERGAQTATPRPAPGAGWPHGLAPTPDDISYYSGDETRALKHEIYILKQNLFSEVKAKCVTKV